MRQKQCMTWNMVRNTEKTCKVKNIHCRIGIWQETLKNVNKEKYTLQELNYSEKTEERLK